MFVRLVEGTIFVLDVGGMMAEKDYGHRFCNVSDAISGMRFMIRKEHRVHRAG